MGARAFIPLTLAGAILLSLAPAAPAAAAEPTDTVLVEPTTPVETTPPTEPTPPAEVPATDPTPVPDPVVADPTPTPTPAPTVTISVVKPVVKPKPRVSEAQQIANIAKRQLGDPWRYGATGPRAFDCSGLVIYAFKQAGDSRAIGNGRLRSARALYRWYQARGLASRSNPKVGDLVIWGGGQHIGIYLGHGKAISTLNRGVRIHGVFAVTARFTAYLHTGMSRQFSR